MTTTSESIITLTSSNFETTLKNAKKVVLVDFWAPWCGPCKAITPILDEIAKEMPDKVQICKLNVDEETEIAAQYNVRAIPTMIFFKNGKDSDQIVGLANKATIKSKITGLS